VYDDMSNGKNFNKDISAVLVKDITVVNDFSYIVHKVRIRLHFCPSLSARVFFGTFT
jgi:hypothetical protein